MPSPPFRRIALLPILIGLSPALLLLAAMILGVLSIEGDTVLVGPRGGPWTRYPARPVQAVTLAILVPLTVLIVTRVIRTAIANLRAARPAPAAQPGGLAPGEPIAWQGRQGWRGVGVARAGIAALATLGPALYAWWLWRIWTAPDPLVLQLFWSAAATIVLCGPAAAPFLAGRGPALRLVRDLFGTVVVTDRRIAWLTLRRARVYREIAARDLVLAAFVEGTERRGWITVTTQTRGEIAEIDLHDVPEPHAALAAIVRLIRPQTTPPAPG
jgi:hypothetical protein